MSLPNYDWLRMSSRQDTTEPAARDPLHHGLLLLVALVIGIVAMQLA